jgi:hypothetical protein
VKLSLLPKAATALLAWSAVDLSPAMATENPDRLVSCTVFRFQMARSQ